MRSPALLCGSNIDDRAAAAPVREAIDKPMIDRENRSDRRRLRTIRARSFEFRSFPRAAGLPATGTDRADAAGSGVDAAPFASVPARGVRD